MPLGTLEQHVFKKVRRPRLAPPLVVGAGAEPDPDGNGSGVGYMLDGQAQAVGH